MSALARPPGPQRDHGTRGVLTQTAGRVNNGKQAPGVSKAQSNVGAEYDSPFVPGLTASARVLYTSRQPVMSTVSRVTPTPDDLRAPQDKDHPLVPAAGFAQVVGTATAEAARRSAVRRRTTAVADALPGPYPAE